MSDLLYEAASCWNELMNYHYSITYGYKGKLTTLQLSFSAREFHHIAGFQYAKDAPIPLYLPPQILEKILARKITLEHISKSRNYEDFIKPRLEAITQLKYRLDATFELYSFFRRFYSFQTSINADYLISSELGGIVFVFLVKSGSTDEEVVCCSAFIKGDRDYKQNQRPRTILKKERTNIQTNEVVVLYDRLTGQKMKNNE